LERDDINRSTLETTIKEVKEEFRNFHFVKRRELITRLGNAFEAIISNLEDVCEEIRYCLQQHLEISLRP
jgi:hypothetical protein